ncbi:MAG: DeoR/GlpR transcriptional regulator [Lentisphaerae bacterium]|jgi:DeoR family fructose operon transcriptional repressor|nr:DeoR/GlpR transcriptional regulator [Lentisphaerota bacterium]
MAQHQHRIMTFEREQRIMQMLRENEFMTVSGLSEELGMSEATVRRDLMSMAERGMLERFHGGAALKTGVVSEMLYTDKEGLCRAAKTSIAAAALELIEDNDIIYLDGGSTVMALARLLEKRRGLTIVTNSLMAASLLMESQHRLILTGGEFRPISRTLVGPLSAPILEGLSVDKAFMGTMGFTIEEGMSTSDAGEAFTKTQVMKRAREVILLCDRTKMGKTSFVRCGEVSDIDVLVTDSLNEELFNALTEANIRIVCGK